ncbi:MAG: hypothetical protein AB8H03_23490 [Saprospiraceae bacterium]
MKNILRLLSCCLLFFIFSNNTFTQIKTSKSFAQKIAKMDLEFLTPVENSYKKVNASESIVVDFDFEIKARKADMRIGFALFPERKNAVTFPHIKVSNMAISAATNDDPEARLVLHEMSKEDLESYQADWGAVVFFQPKRIFSDKDHCKMLALYREGKGLVYVFYLFDEASEEVDFQKNCLSFLPKEIKEEK